MALQRPRHPLSSSKIEIPLLTHFSEELFVGGIISPSALEIHATVTVDGTEVSMHLHVTGRWHINGANSSRCHTTYPYLVTTGPPQILLPALPSLPTRDIFTGLHELESEPQEPENCNGLNREEEEKKQHSAVPSLCCMSYQFLHCTLPHPLCTGFETGDDFSVMCPPGIDRTSQISP